ncbi:MAG: dolichyl-phosphate-mannose-protein mannosyltransferase [Micromonosporaceae bacterium]|jgi:dolichyl-phosphate-mannose--protein O-mannosyl transferase|nr:dolichyl-phosphate-mannose-protein mannosyltransferase [Micromonosporaceae bacterium]
MPAGGWRSWAAAGLVVAIGAILRFVNLGLPDRLIFDEVYYATEGAELFEHGVEWLTETDAAGNVTVSRADFVVHPPLGKWIIGLGIKMFGNTAFGWRFMAAVVGVISILIITRTARRMFASTVLGCAAGLLMALDGIHLVLSRTAILDIFLTFFIVAAFACVVLDRDARRTRWLRRLEHGLDPTQSGRLGRPRLSWAGVPWWRLSAGVMLGCGCAVKWSAIWFVPVFALLIFLWEAGTRRTVGVRHPWRDTLLDETGWVLAMVALVVVVYLASWTGWFLSDDGWKVRPRSCCSEPPHCGGPFFPALVGLAWFGVTRRDWRAGAIGAGAAAGILPWFYFELKHRTMYYFYALPAEPFLVMAVVYVLGTLINGPGVGEWMLADGYARGSRFPPRSDGCTAPSSRVRTR